MTTIPRWARAGQGLLLLVIGAALVMRAATPPAVVPPSAPATVFSAGRAMAHVRAIAERPHPTGSPQNVRVRGYLLGTLRSLGLSPTVQDAVGVGTRHRMAGHVQNIVARIPGTARSGRAVMLVSHYDSQGAAPGAGDAASATAAILETVRALRAGPPLGHDVIVLITDGEEAGLLGAAAFVREHPWARDVEMILNFEARGTEGRSFMFETGGGNLDAVRVLGRLRDVSATSLMVMVYRILPNDTDLSELMVLGKPAMNFAFIDGVERYHTAHDDVAHLDPRSVQHHGAQALALTRAFASGPLPRPRTGDAVFFDVPFAGLIVYPESWAVPLALVAAVIALLAAWRSARREPRAAWSVVLALAGGVVCIVFSVVAAIGLSRAIVALHDATGWYGAPEWRGLYAAAVAALVLAITSGVWTIVRSRASAGGASAGALVLWAGLTVLVTARAPGASYLLVWPLLAAALASLVVSSTRSPAGHALALFVATAVIMTMLVPLVYLLGVALGLALPGAAAAAVLVALGAWLAAAHLEASFGARRWTLPALPLATSIVLLAAGAITVRADDAHPTRRSLTYEVDADTMGDGAPPATEVLTDSSAGTLRELTLRVWSPGRALALRMRADAPVAKAVIGGRTVDTTRYRRRVDAWDLTYVAPPDSGFVVALTVPAGAPLVLDLDARQAGVPAVISSRDDRARLAEVPSGHGDVTQVRRRVRF